MSLNRKIESLVHGVSQRDPKLRHPFYAEAVENSFPHSTLGLLKRPPLAAVGVLDVSTTGYENPYEFIVERSPTEKYFVVVSNGKVAAYDALTGASVTVQTPDARGLTYLTGTAGYRAVTIGNSTIILNRGKTVKQGLTKAPERMHEALLFVRQADFSTTYEVKLDGTTISYTTVDASNPTARSDVSTNNIAANIFTKLTANQFLSQQFNFLQLGSTVWVQRKDKHKFDLTSTDGLADKGLRVIKGTVQTFDDLPARAINGMVVEVIGAAESDKDNYWVKYDDSSSPGQDGVWRECPKPGTAVDLDETTMPWSLALRGEVRKRIINEGIPALPKVSEGNTVLYTNGWTIWGPDSSGLSGTEDQHLTSHLDYVETTLTSLDGTVRRLMVTYDIDTSVMEHGRRVQMVLFVDTTGTGASYVGVTSKYYNTGEVSQNEQLVYTAALPVGTKVRLMMVYTAGPLFRPSITRKAIAVAHASTHTHPGIQHMSSQSTQIAFPATDVYPLGTVVTTTIDTIVFTHTVADNTSTGTTVATAVKNLVDAHASFIATNPSAGVVLVSTSAGLIPASTIVDITVNASTTLTNFDLGLTVNELVGKTIKNLTDGSEGVVTSNGVHTIVCSAGLTGGANNKFNNGDECSVLSSGAYFVLQPVGWAEREAGDTKLCPFPSFVGTQLLDAFFYKNRLGFTAGENVVLSAAGDLFRFSRYSQAQLFDDDAIDVKATFKDFTIFRNTYVSPFGLVLFSDVGPFILSGKPLLSPKTVRIDPLYAIATLDLRSVLCGDAFMLASVDSGFTRVHEMYLQMGQDENVVASLSDITTEVPRYLAGVPRAMVGDGKLGFLAVALESDPTSLFVYSWKDEGDKRIMAGWHKWTFTGADIRRLTMSTTGLLGIFMKRGTEMVFETLDIQNPVYSPANYVDRGSIAYTQKFKPSRIYLRDDSQNVITTGRTTVRFLKVHYSDSTNFDVKVTLPGRALVTTQFRSISPATGVLHVPVMGKAEDAIIEIVSASEACNIQLIEWEGTHFNRNK